MRDTARMTTTTTPSPRELRTITIIMDGKSRDYKKHGKVKGGDGGAN